MQTSHQQRRHTPFTAGELLALNNDATLLGPQLRAGAFLPAGQSLFVCNPTKGVPGQQQQQQQQQEPAAAQGRQPVVTVVQQPQPAAQQQVAAAKPACPEMQVGIDLPGGERLPGGWAARSAWAVHSHLSWTRCSVTIIHVSHARLHAPAGDFGTVKAATAEACCEHCRVSKTDVPRR